MIGLEEICQRIRNNDPSFVFLYLVQKNLLPQDLMALAEALNLNTHITSLYLSWNNMDIVGIQALANALPNTNINSLNLQSCNIDFLCVQALANALPNTNITSLNVQDCNIDSEGVKALAEAVEVHKCITNLDFKYNRHIGDAECSRLDSLIERNQQFRIEAHKKLKRIEFLTPDEEKTLIAHADEFLIPIKAYKKLKRREFLTLDEETRLIAHVDESKRSEVIELIREIQEHDELQHIKDKNNPYAMTKVLRDSNMLRNISEFLDGASIANLRQAIKGCLLPVYRSLSGALEHPTNPLDMKLSQSDLQASIIDLTPGTRSNLVSLISKEDFSEKVVSKVITSLIKLGRGDAQDNEINWKMVEDIFKSVPIDKISKVINNLIKLGSVDSEMVENISKLIPVMDLVSAKAELPNESHLFNLATTSTILSGYETTKNTITFYCFNMKNILQMLVDNPIGFSTEDTTDSHRIPPTFLTAEQSFYTGTWTGNFIVSPAIRYLNDQVTSQNQEKQFIGYYYDQFTLKNFGKAILSNLLWSNLPDSLSIADKTLVTKLFGDVISGEASLSSTYANSILGNLAFSFASFAMMMKSKQSEYYQNYPFAFGVLASTVGDIIKLSYDSLSVATHTCYDYLIGKDYSPNIEEL